MQTTAGQHTEISTDERHWERILWKQLPYPDNYVPPKQFLASLRKNGKLIRERAILN
jgi:Phosphatidylinositol N-acetylglucosaminyltransferase